MARRMLRTRGAPRQECLCWKRRRGDACRGLAHPGWAFCPVKRQRHHRGNFLASDSIRRPFTQLQQYVCGVIRNRVEGLVTVNSRRDLDGIYADHDVQRHQTLESPGGCHHLAELGGEAIGQFGLRSHWSEMPEWGQGRSLWAMYFTFGEEVQLHRLVADYQNQLREIDGIDLIARNWLHLTMQGIGFTDEVPLDLVNRILKRAEKLKLPRPGTVGPPLLDLDAIAMPVAPISGLVNLRQGLLSIATDVLGARAPYRLPEPVGGFSPHISIGYANTEVPAAHLIPRLERVQHHHVEIRFSHISLLRLYRSSRQWHWDQEYRILQAAD
jgi:2'-5' RNA ligase